MTSRYYSTPEAARLSGMTLGNLHWHFKAVHDLKAVRMGRRWCIEERELQRFIRARKGKT